MCKKMLYILNVANHVNNFSYTSMIAAQSLGFEYHIAGNWGYKDDYERREDERKYGIHIYQIDFIRTPYHLGNIKAYYQLAKIVEKEQFDVIHCNTPIGGVIGRLLGKRYKTPSVIYQAHGFHFYKGAPLKNWLFYYPAERWLAHYTDAILTINKEDYERAKKFKLKNNGKVYFVPGVGIDTSQYHSDRQLRLEKRRELELRDDDIALISIGDLIVRKNYQVGIEAISESHNSHLHYYICGNGPEKERLNDYSKKFGIEKQIHFLGYRTDIRELLQAADIFLLTSHQEGLARSLMEAMASGLPCIVSRIRGNTDLLSGNNGGILCDSVQDYVDAICRLANDSALRKHMSLNNLITVQRYSIGEVAKEITDVYSSELGAWGGGVIDFVPAWVRKRTEINIPISAVMIISVGELNSNKNNQVIIKALSKLSDDNIHYVLCGVGNKEDELKTLSQELNIENNVHFLGYRTDIIELLNASDIFVMPSYREGLSRSIMEAMASGLPCLVSKIRGNVDLIEDEVGGFLLPADDISVIAEKLKVLASDEILRKTMSTNNLERINEFDTTNVIGIMYKIYQNELNLVV